MKKNDKLKRQRYEISMRIISLESKERSSGLNANEVGELEILRRKEEELNARIELLSSRNKS
ncbi:MAG: hypothetical protein Kow00127_01250 [Bacteroidales bacterium]